jgi:hypothetical protein
MNKEVKITVKAIRRTDPDLRRLARALLQQVLDNQSRATKPTERPTLEQTS